jgi:hypothetical protein
MVLRFYNTLTQQVQPFVPADPNAVRMYTCGPTVYDFAHIRNFRTFVSYDLLRRVLHLNGYKLDHVMNITDVDRCLAWMSITISVKDTRCSAGACPDLDLATTNGPVRVFTLLHDARPVLLNLGGPGGFDLAQWADRLQLVDAEYAGSWELPAIGAVPAPTAVLVRPDGYVAWVGDRTQVGLTDALITWFGPPTAV